MLQRAVTSCRRHMCHRAAMQASAASPPPTDDLMDRFRKDPKTTTSQIVRAQSVLPPRRVEAMLLHLVKARHKEEASNLLEYSMKRSIDLDYDMMFHSAVRESKLHMNGLAQLMIAHPAAFSTSLRLHALRGCLGAKNYRAAIALFNQIEHESFTPKELNKPLLTLLRQLTEAPPHAAAGLRDVQFQLTDTIMFRNAAKTHATTLLAGVYKLNPAATPDCVKLLVYTSFAAPQSDWHRKLEEVASILGWCVSHAVALPSAWCFTTGFLKAKAIDYDATAIAEAYVDMVEAGLVPPAMEPSWLAVQVGANSDALEMRCLRALMASNGDGLTRQMYHYGFALCHTRDELQVAQALFLKLTTSTVKPNERTLGLLVPLLQGAPPDQIESVLAYFASHNVRPSPKQYHRLMET
ncbi:Aste57867_10195 [Aphanomyces stellatus]|uniref:Aste57867_10195 protein n=1 Tax=Aphanomyces stellatus TaxID=120398 RepID=A0A485KPR8_9STRA|nr:hypothetical protein As57867_010156 [Aphanomyces stellatus]VFT87071.1 Aste57867_10195 [Aphanomyces stellatus]